MRDSIVISFLLSVHLVDPSPTLPLVNARLPDLSSGGMSAPSDFREARAEGPLHASVFGNLETRLVFPVLAR